MKRRTVTTYKMQLNDHRKRGTTKKKVFCITNGKTYDDAEAAGAELNISRALIGRCALGRIDEAKGYQFKYLES